MKGPNEHLKWCDLKVPHMSWSWSFSAAKFLQDSITFSSSSTKKKEEKRQNPNWLEMNYCFFIQGALCRLVQSPYPKIDQRNLQIQSWW
jgi:hypothetical protein